MKEKHFCTNEERFRARKFTCSRPGMEADSIKLRASFDNKFNRRVSSVCTELLRNFIFKLRNKFKNLGSFLEKKFLKFINLDN